MKNLRPNGDRAKVAVTLIWIVLALEIASLISGYLQYNLLQTLANGGEISPEAAYLNDIRERIIAIATLVVMIISVVMFILWFRRAYYNLHQKVDYLAHSEGWAAGCWFVPILNLFRPYQIMKELYVETRTLLVRNNITPNNALSVEAVGWWWTLWIISGIVGNVTFRTSLKADTVDELIFTTVVSMVGNVIALGLAPMAVSVIKRYAAVEPQLSEAKSYAEEQMQANSDSV